MNSLTNPKFLRPLPVDPVLLRPNQRRHKPIGQILVEMGELSSADMIKAVALNAREDARFGDILLTHGMVTQDGLNRGLAKQYACEIANLEATKPDIRLIDALGADFCLKHGIVPWRRVGGATVVVTSRPENFSEIQSHLDMHFGHVMMALSSEQEIQNVLLRLRRRKLSQRAENRVSPLESCRTWQSGSLARITISLVLFLVAALIAAPKLTLFVLSCWAVVTLVVNTALKLAATIATLRDSKAKKPGFQTQRQPMAASKLPKVSVMVPLFKERSIANHLVRRLGQLSYPKELLDICLVVEEDDTVTQGALCAAQLPHWMRQITVPRGSLKTKPRALNYALDFCHGSIIGVFDAEDAPEPDQIFKIVRRFQNSDSKLACLQGVLDFYNPHQNWLARCFTVEYATWFRVVLPGLQKIGFAIPLGGTTLFFRRSVLEELGGWDAHNVTEDADLGIRLARHGYRAELIATTTYEEANCHFWPWIKQRSRWLKGYAMTWAVHMRSPRKLLQDLGPRKFLGFHLLFLGTISQFLLAPLLWTFWALPLGLSHPIADYLPANSFILLTALFLLSEVATIAVGIFAVSTNQHRGLWMWVPTLHFYFPLGAAAAYKALWEIIVKPFYWDKTAHGIHDQGATAIEKS